MNFTRSARLHASRRPLAILALLVLAVTLATSVTSCTSTNPQVAARNKIIASEPRGNYYVGRRYYMPKTRWWGFLRQPGQPWSKARAVVMNESRTLTPDRLPENEAAGGQTHGYDHNYEYIIKGSYTGRTIYDPNANIFAPEFLLADYELRNKSPGFLFLPNEVYSPVRVPDQASGAR